MFLAVLLVFLVFAPQPSTISGPTCTGGVSGAADLCAGDREFAQAQASPAGAERTRHLRAALGLYRKAASSTNDPGTKIKALDATTRTLDAKHLNDPAALELVLRELIGLAPSELSFMFRLGKLQEDQGQTDEAETTLLTVHHQHPQELEPYKMLAQFYARRATAISSQIAQAQAPSASPPEIPGTPDKDGVYRVGGGVPPAQRVENPLYPEDARAAGISGAVQAEIVVNETGSVTNATIVKSVPLLDEAALSAVKEWRFRPAIVNGQAVPIRMVVTVTFTLSK